MIQVIDERGIQQGRGRERVNANSWMSMISAQFWRIRAARGLVRSSYHNLFNTNIALNWCTENLWDLANYSHWFTQQVIWWNKFNSCNELNGQLNNQFYCIFVIVIADPETGGGGGGARNMKCVQPPSAAIFLWFIFTGPGGMAPSPSGSATILYNIVVFSRNFYLIDEFQPLFNFNLCQSRKN